MATIVTAFITNINNIEFRSYDKYMELGKKLLSQPIPTVCFLEKKIYDMYFSEELQEYPLTVFKIFEKNDNYLMKYEDKLSNFHLNTDNPTKDTPGYVFIQCHKTEWVKTVAEENPFFTTNFIWIDFGIFHMIKNELAFASALEKLSRKKYNSVRIASCVDPNSESERDIYRWIAWFFAGSIFGGPKEKLIDFSQKMKKICLEIIYEKKHLMWEVNIWYLLHKKYPELFDPYYANHDVSILDNY